MSRLGKARSSRSRSWRYGIIVLAELALALAVGVWCYLRGRCNGVCLPLAELPSRVCLVLAVKILVLLLVPTALVWAIRRSSN